MSEPAEQPQDRLLEALRAERVLERLGQRIRCVAEQLVPEQADRRLGDLLAGLVERCRDSGRNDEAWLLLAAVSAGWPGSTQVRRLVQKLRSEHPEQVLRYLLAEVLRHPKTGSPELEMELVSDGVVVVADFCARYDFNSGIQRTVRQTLPRWESQGHRFVTGAYTRTGDGVRTLRRAERRRIFDYDGPRSRTPDEQDEVRLVVPWHSTVVLPEVPVGRAAVPMAGLAEMSGNTVGCIGYDAIPLVHAELRRPNDSERFLQYLSVVKHAHRVAGISTSARQEFAGFAAMLPAQGIAGPEVSEVLLPAEAPVVPPGAEPAGRVLPHTAGRVQVLCVGAKETHKNHRAVLYAAERLWREGLAFDLSFIGGRGWTPEQFEAAFDRLAAEGRPLRHLGRVSEAELDAAYREADFTIFLSLQEGFGLPVAESLSCGTPVLTSDFGSLAEIAADGGALVADPRDDEQVTAQIRRLVVDPALREELRAQARRRPVRTWDEYATELWSTLVGVA